MKLSTRSALFGASSGFSVSSCRRLFAGGVHTYRPERKSPRCYQHRGFPAPERGQRSVARGELATTLLRLFGVEHVPGEGYP